MQDHFEQVVDADLNIPLFDEWSNGVKSRNFGIEKEEKEVVDVKYKKYEQQLGLRVPIESLRVDLADWSPQKSQKSVIYGQALQNVGVGRAAWKTDW